jgi:hypothetical protein
MLDCAVVQVFYTLMNTTEMSHLKFRIFGKDHKLRAIISVNNKPTNLSVRNPVPRSRTQV